MTGSSSGDGRAHRHGSVPRWPPASFLGSLTDSQRESLLALGVARVYVPGDVVLRQGDRGGLVVLILRGIAKVTVIAETGKETLLGIRGAGELIGEMATLSSQPRSATVVAATELHGRVILAAPFVTYLDRSPQVASRLAEMVAERLRAANRRRLEFNAYPVEGRVARVLGEVARTHGHPDRAGWRIGPEITQADLASLSSVSVRTVEKVLRLFEQDGLVARRRRDLFVVDPAALDARAEHFTTIPS